MNSVIICMAAVGLVSTSTTQWIQPRTSTYPDADVGLFRKEVVNPQSVAKAEWTVAALGVFEASVNGKEVGGFLKGGFTQPEKVRQSHTFDVTTMWNLTVGATNTLEATVAASWWRDAIMRRDLVSRKAGYPRNSALHAELHLTFADGSKTMIPTDTSWDATYAGIVVSSGIYEGERQNLTRQAPYNEFDAPRWQPAEKNDDFTGEIRPLKGPDINLREDLVMKSDAALPMQLEPNREYVFDFHQNASAIERLVVEGEKETKVRVRHAEMLNEPGGDPKRGNDGPGGTLYLSNLRGIDALSIYVLKEGRQTLMPHFTFYGYRYIGITVTRPVTLHSVESVPVTSIHRESECASFECGDKDVNQLVSNIRWGFRSNYLSVPTDCPQRNERLGWTADTMVFSRAAMYLADVRGFLNKWLDDLKDTQSAEGAYEFLAPLVWSRSVKMAASGWADAGVLVPYFLWKHYGERAAIDDHWQSMCLYMSYLRAHDGHDLNCFGDWVAYELKTIAPERQFEYRCHFGAFYWVWDSMVMREMAEARGDSDAARQFAADEKKARELFAQKFIGEDGLVREEFRTQAVGLYMLALNLCRDEAVAKEVKRQLLDNIHAHGNCLQTGFLGTAIIMDTLTEIGKTSLAYTLLLQHEDPSWLYSVDQGATTIWERWNSYTKAKGFGPASMNSFNHYAYGAVFSWMMGTAAGIKSNAQFGGFAQFRLAPKPDRRLGWVKASYNSPNGRIVSEWKYSADDKCEYHFVIPEGTSATIELPNGTTCTRGPGEYRIKE